MLIRTILAALLLGCSAGRLAAAPAIVWASDPVEPGQAVVVIGVGFGDRPRVVLAKHRQAEAEAVPSLERPIDLLRSSGGKRAQQYSPAVHPRSSQP